MPSNTKVNPALELIKQDSSKVLGLTVGKHNITEPGQYVPRADAQSPPQLTYADASPGATYLVIALDLDAPFPSFGVLGPILHWIQPGLSSIQQQQDHQQQSTSVTPAAALAPSPADTPFIANYIGPAPPPGSAPHRYAFFLYEQPAALDAARFAPAGGKPLGNLGRMWASLDDWVGKLGLGDVVAVNYFKSN